VRQSGERNSRGMSHDHNLGEGETCGKAKASRLLKMQACQPSATNKNLRCNPAREPVTYQVPSRRLRRRSTGSEDEQHESKNQQDHNCKRHEQA